MTPKAFIGKWRAADLKERSAAQEHFIDLCRLLDEPTPAEADPTSKRSGRASRLGSPSSSTSPAPAGTRSRPKRGRPRKRCTTVFLERLQQARILDPACGSGNFLYLGLHPLMDFEHRVNVDAEALGLDRQFPSVGPECVQGIEINLFAAELARTTVWIGEIQWLRRNGFDVSRRPILRPCTRRLSLMCWRR